MINLKNTILGTAVILAASLQISAAATYYVQTDTLTSPSIYSGKLPTATATTAIVKTGTGELDLTGDNSTFLGTVKINAGILGVNNVNNLGSTQATEFTGNATFKNVVAGTASAASLTLKALTIGSGTTGTLIPASGTVITISSLLGSGATPAVGNMFVNGAGGTVSVASALPAGPGNYTVTAGTLKLSDKQATSATGGVSILAAGTLDCSSSSTALPSGTLTMASGATLILGAGNFSGNIIFN